MYEKAKFVCLYLMRPQKIKCESVRINKKHVLYNMVMLWLPNIIIKHAHVVAQECLYYELNRGFIVIFL